MPIDDVPGGGVDNHALHEADAIDCGLECVALLLGVGAPVERIG